MWLLKEGLDHLELACHLRQHRCAVGWQEMMQMCPNECRPVETKFEVVCLDGQKDRCCCLGHQTGCDLKYVLGLNWDHIAREKILYRVRALPFHRQRGSSLPAAGLVVGRGVVSRSPALDDCRGGELMIMPSLANCEGGACVDRTGDDWKNSGEEDAAAAPPLGCLEFLGVA